MRIAASRFAALVGASRRRAYRLCRRLVPALQAIAAIIAILRGAGLLPW